jgi:S1-C subfamily serine protease
MGEMQMDEQSNEGQQPGTWDSWLASADQPGAGGSDPSAEGQQGYLGPAAASPAGEAVRPGEQPTAFTQPIGYPQGAYGQPGQMPPPGYGYGQPGFAQAGYPQHGQPASGPGQPGQPGYSADPSGHGYQPGGGFGQPPGAGFGQPPGGYGGYGGHGGYGTPGGYGRPPRRRGLTTAITYLAVAALAATAGGLVVSFADQGNSTPSASSGSGNGGSGNFNLPNNNFPGNGYGNSGQTTKIPQATQQRVEAAVTPGLVVITSNLKYDGSGVGAEATGMIISSSGLVLTNNHVISGTTGLTARVVSTGRQYTAQWLGYDKSSDVAVIQLESASGLHTVPLGDSSTVKVGDQVIGMGNAGGTGRISDVLGTITGLNQTITASDDGSGIAPERLTGMLETNADIIPGDSGGPLASTDGKVIGMDTAASTNGNSSQSADVGFAIPINTALAIARQIIAGQSSSDVHIGSSGFIGVLVPSAANGTESTQTNPELQLRQEESTQHYGQSYPAPGTCLPNDSNPQIPAKIAPVTAGTLVLGALCQTPAATAGLIPGDVITGAAGRAVTSPSSLTSILQTFRSGSTISLTWVTPTDQTVTRSVTLATAPPQ